MKKCNNKIPSNKKTAPLPKNIPEPKTHFELIKQVPLFDFIFKKRVQMEYDNNQIVLNNKLASELKELLFELTADEYDIEKVKEEMADVQIMLSAYADALNLDLGKLVKDKFEKDRIKKGK